MANSTGVKEKRNQTVSAASADFPSKGGTFNLPEYTMPTYRGRGGVGQKGNRPDYVDLEKS